MTRSLVATTFWVVLTAAVVTLEAHSLSKIATPEQVFAATLIFALMVMTFTVPPIFVVLDDERSKR